MSIGGPHEVLPSHAWRQCETGNAVKVRISGAASRRKSRSASAALLGSSFSRSTLSLTTVVLFTQYFTFVRMARWSPTFTCLLHHVPGLYVLDANPMVRGVQNRWS